MQSHDDPYTQGAQDARYQNLNRAFAFESNERLSYEAGWRRALKLACQRLDAAEILPHHFSEKETSHEAS